MNNMSNGATYSRDEVIDTLGIAFVRGLEMMGSGDKDRRLISLEFGDEEDSDVEQN
tara:strand:- start:516 stop:683 length:168 start_codon:yes stop_codon:yes gene_type:complete